MTDSIPPTPDSPQPPAVTPITPPPKRKRRWLRALLVLAVVGVIGIVFLVALLPTLLSLSPVRSFALGRAQAFIPHGNLEAADWSLGWFSPIRLTGVKLYDDKGQLVIEADEVKTDLTLLRAVRQQFVLGDTVVDAAGHLVVYPNGSTNLQHVLGLDETVKHPATTSPHEPKPATHETETAIPDASANITLKLHGDVRLVDAADSTIATVRLLPGSGGTIQIVNVNQPIETDLQFQYDTGDATRAGRIGLKSSLDAVENNKLDLAKLAGTLDLPISDVDLAALKPVLAMVGQNDVQLKGVLAGRLSGELKPGVAGGVKGRFDVAGFEAIAPQLSAPYRGDIGLPIEVSRVVTNGASHLQLDVGLTTPEAAVRVTGDMSDASIMNLTATARLARKTDAEPLVDAAVTVANYDSAAQKIASLSVTKCVVSSLPRLQAFLDPYVPAFKTQQISLASGSVNAVVDAKDIDVASRTLNLTRCDASIPQLRVLRNGKELFKDDLTFALAATAAKAGDGLAIDVTTLSLKSALATLQKADGPLHVELQGGLPRGRGTVAIGVDAVQANRLARAATTQPTPEVSAGRFDGKLTLASEAGKNASAGLSGTLAGLTLTDTPVKDESYTLDLNADVTPAFDHVDAGVRIRGAYFSVIGKNIAVKQPAEGVPVQKLIENAVFDISVKDAARVQTVLTALVPGFAPTMKIAGGLGVQATVAGGKVDATVEGSRLSLTNAAGRAFTFDPKKPVTLKLAATIDGEKAIDGLHVTALDGNLDVASITLAEPIVVAGLTTTPTAQGKITLSGSVERGLALLAVLQQADAPMPYVGRYTFTQAVGPKGGAIAVKGDGAIDDFAVLDAQGKPTVSEKRVTIGNDLTIDVAKQIATIAAVTLDMTASKAATVAMHGGVEDWSTGRRLKDVVVKIDAVGEKIWPIVYGLMPPAQQTQFQDAKLAGPIKIDLLANGAYPVKPTWNESVRDVVAYGNIAVHSMATNGVSASDFVQPFSVVEQGKLITGDMRKKKGSRFAKAFNVNNGLGDFGNIQVDLGDPSLKLTIGKGQKLLQKVELNPVMAAQLGSLASVIFNDAEEASGLIDLTVLECKDVPLLDLMNKKATASFEYSVHDLRLDGKVPAVLSKALQWGDQGIVGDISNATLALKKGVAYQDMTVALQKQAEVRNDEGKKEKKNVTETMKVKGGVDLASNRFRNYTLNLSPGLLPKDLRKSLPDGATLELNGNVSDIGRVMAEAVGKFAVQGFGTDAVEKLLGGLNKKKSKEK